MELSEYSAEELQSELKRRNEFVESPVQEPLPQPMNNPSYDLLHTMCVDYVKSVAEDKVDDDHSHYIFEAAIEAVYGKDIWDWINKKQRV